MKKEIEYCENGYIKIYAKPALNPTGIKLVQGRKYYFKTSGEWQDSERIDPCSGGGFQNPKLDRFNWMKSVPEANWFCLIGKVDGIKFPMGESGDFEAKATGDLFCFANDVCFMRWNNLGHICLKIQEEPF